MAAYEMYCNRTHSYSYKEYDFYESITQSKEKWKPYEYKREKEEKESLIKLTIN